ncbi:MAG TPA: hypothetical protein VLV85_15455 [Stellaceae bacterium]|jgi:hypothetical protein|nr:hypothetical protein [Stellaceae bacterium]
MYKIVAMLLTISALAPAAASADELEERQATMQQVAIDFFAQNFTRLDAMEDELRRTRRRTSSGIWYLDLFYAGIEASVARDVRSDDTWPAAAARFQRWAQAFPNSRAAHIAYARALISRAWFYRGAAYADAVPPEAWAPFRRYARLAADELSAHKAAADVDPMWYATMLDVARALDWPKQNFRDLLHEAMTAEPDFYPTYFAALPYLLPQWHGSLREVESFADEAVVATRQSEGTSMYARIYWYLSQTCCGDEIFARTLDSWPKMRAAFDDMIARYPDGWNVNNYARFACLAGDRATAKRLFLRLGDAAMTEVWTPPGLFERCRSWATGGGRPL